MVRGTTRDGLDARGHLKILAKSGLEISQNSFEPRDFLHKDKKTKNSHKQKKGRFEKKKKRFFM